MDIVRVESRGRGAFIASENSVKIGEITYAWDNSRSFITIRHTGVDDAYKGKGIGNYLVKEIVNFARLEGVKVIPKCPFAKKIFERQSEYGDVLLNSGK